MSNFLANRLGGQQRRTHDAHQRAIKNSPHRAGYRDPRNVERKLNDATAGEAPERRAAITRSVGATSAPRHFSGTRVSRRGSNTALVGSQIVALRHTVSLTGQQAEDPQQALEEAAESIRDLIAPKPVEPKPGGFQLLD